MTILGAICLVDREEGATQSLASEHGVALRSIFTLAELRAKNNSCCASVLTSVGA